MQDHDTVKINSDLHALSQLFEANQELARTERMLQAAKDAHKQAKEYRNALLELIDTYTVQRREDQARRSLFEQGFRKGPEWLKPGEDPDKPAAE